MRHVAHAGLNPGLSKVRPAKSVTSTPETTTTDFLKGKERKVGQLYLKLLAEVSRQLIEAGLTNPALEATHAYAKKIFFQLLQLVEPQPGDPKWVLDHTGVLLAEARRHRKSENPWLATVLYAMWFEHKLNQWILTLHRKAGLQVDEIDHVIRGASYKCKYSLLPLVVKHRLPAQHRSTIDTIMELRNGLVHYKWKPVNHALRRQLDEVCGAAEKAVAYFHYFERRYLGKVSPREGRTRLGLK